MPPKAIGGYQDRQIIRTRAALYALDMLRRMALGLDVPDSVRFTPETADLSLIHICVLPYIVLVTEAQRIAVLGDPDVVLADEMCIRDRCSA